ncbi:YdcF family protein [Micropruina sp.]|uniref:YdcF family protein n=1 Tax=Micropruina sp. TaxID=2737536 RepID=UPI0039E5CFA0
MTSVHPRAVVVLLALATMMFGTSALVVPAPTRAADGVSMSQLKAQAIYYLAKDQTALRKLMVGTITARSARDGRLWSGLLNTWATINKSMTMNTSVPAGLPKTGHVFVVLGSALTSRGTVGTKFKRRLALAVKASKTYPTATVLISGGAARNGVTEAKAGYRWLRAKGIAAKRLITETRSFSSLGNATHTMALLARAPAYTSYSLISDSSHLRIASVLFEAATVLVQEKSGRSWSIKRHANLAYPNLKGAGRGPLRSSSVAAAATGVASIFSVTSAYRALLAKAPSLPKLTGLRVTAPNTRTY